MRFYLAITALLFLVACNNTSPDNSESSGTNTVLSGITAPVNMQVNIIGIYPHDTGAYTQGLEIFNGKMFESTGDFVNSSLRITDIKTGKVMQKHSMGSPDVFGEGITIFRDKIYQLTWKNHLVNVYDLNNIQKPIKTFTWPYEGWGITHNGSELIISDGTANLYFVNPEDFKLQRTMQVTDNIGPVKEINELEFIDGYIFANVYGADYIIRIDPSNGHVTGIIHLKGIIKEYAKGYIPDENEVLNGIAWDSIGKKMYITGKHWPKLFELTIN